MVLDALRQFHEVSSERLLKMLQLPCSINRDLSKFNAVGVHRFTAKEHRRLALHFELFYIPEVGRNIGESVVHGLLIPY